MPDFSDVCAWASALKTSPAFVIALPIAVATLLATIVDWIEVHLTGPQSGEDGPDAHIESARCEDDPHRRAHSLEPRGEAPEIAGLCTAG